MNILAYEMKYAGDRLFHKIELVPFEDKYYKQYETIYNDCFFDMRRAMDVKPYAYYHSISQLEGRKDKIYLYLQEGEIIGSFVLDGHEIDDIIVNTKYQGRGYGKELLKCAITMMQERGIEPIILHVALWNERAFHMYETNGFETSLVIKVKHEEESFFKKLFRRA